MDVAMDGNVQGRTQGIQRSDTEKLLMGGAAEFSQSLKKERNWANRLLLRHVVKHENPIYRIGRLLLGVSLCLFVNRMTRCLDHLTAIFNFYLCVSTDANAIVDIREVLVGGVLGTAVGGLFQAAAIAASGPYAPAPTCTSTPAEVTAFEQFTYNYGWNQMWALSIGVAVTYYALHLARLEGSDYLQVGTAVISILAMVLIDFPYFPLVPLLDPNNMWTPVIMNWVTRALSLACACVVAFVFWAGYLLVTRLVTRWKETRKAKRFLENIE